MICFFLAVINCRASSGDMGVDEKGAGLVQDEAVKTIQTNSFKTKREKNLATGQDLVLLIMDYTPARRKTPIHN